MQYVQAVVADATTKRRAEALGKGKQKLIEREEQKKRLKTIALQPNQVVPEVDNEGDNAVDGTGAHTADGGGPVLACVEVAPSIGAPFALASVSSAGAGGAGAPAATGGPLFDPFDDALGGLGALGC